MPKEKLLTFVSVTFQQMPFILPSFVYQLLAQDNDQWKAIIIHDGLSTDGSREFMEDVVSRYPEHFTYLESPERVGNWGHKNRHTALMMVDTPWVAMTNADNQYCYAFVKHFIGDMTDGKTDAQVFPISHSYFGYEPFYRGFGCGATDLMQFIIRTEMAQAVGFTSELHHADGVFLEALKTAFPNMRLGVRNGLFGFHN
jgi:hypothetical protein